MQVDTIGFCSGDVFREYRWHGPWVNASMWQRVTDPHTLDSRAQVFLPNLVNTIVVDDLQGAINAELCLEQWGGHAGTSEKRLRINGHEWIEIPESRHIGPDMPEAYHYFRYPVIPIPLEQLHDGQNTFELTCGNQLVYKIGDGWGQWGIHGAILRIYYDSEKPHLTGILSSPVSNSSIGEHVLLTFEWDELDVDKEYQVDRVEFLGYYEDFDHNGDGVYKEWHYQYRQGQLRCHAGTADAFPYALQWDTSWIPDQNVPITLMARVTNYQGMTCITPVVEGLDLTRDYSVKMYYPYDVPPHWSTRAGNTHTCKVDISEDLKHAVAAKMVFSSWNGHHADEIGINDTKLLSRTGRNHDVSYTEAEVPLELLQQGTNIFYTTSATLHHGIEILWPGIVLKVQYQQ